VKKKSCGNKTASKFWKFYHVYDSTDKRPTKLDTDKDYACWNLCGQDICFFGKAGTGGIRGHLIGQHPEMLVFVSSLGRSCSTATTDGGMKWKADIRD
jgi:hypothetical protein